MPPFTMTFIRSRGTPVTWYIASLKATGGASVFRGSLCVFPACLICTLSVGMTSESSKDVLNVFRTLKVVVKVKETRCSSRGRAIERRLCKPCGYPNPETAYGVCIRDVTGTRPSTLQGVQRSFHLNLHLDNIPKVF